MKRLKTILLNLLLALVIPASLSAQTDAERKFLASADSLNTQLLNAYTGKDYPTSTTHMRRNWPKAMPTSNIPATTPWPASRQYKGKSKKPSATCSKP